ncbi:fungal-specific transcription factor domain-containing protein [Talaromyces proteolyticus]|uniref:Fungal-specific transcription factor domain-containing protein n=1 Tax=Talaromyces proteolyticus TaxID=1131652 RepID=A0AAD4PSI9_9EURO|nr:fungal-specific transcription factor domain-containing protein [Talaromyces proteolyticus]KAH8691446.1 fungal-specific transcription factor domain-containing protein [Talaromyces proteolyticus]
MPAFAKPFSAAITPGHLQRLYKDGVFDVPSTSLQNALLRTFINYVFPCIPVVDLEFLESITKSRKSGEANISLLLYHSIMFSATSYVPMEDLIRAGYSSRKEACEPFFQRAKHLYESGYESDELIIVQALLLLTYMSGQTEDTRDCWNWVGVTVSVALKLGLFQDHPGPEVSCIDQKLLKRVGWACFMQDCLISLTLRCRPRIQKHDFQLECLKEEDFDLDTLITDIKAGSFEFCSAKDFVIQKDLILLCVSTAKLCVCINMVLEIQGKNNNQTNNSALIEVISSPQYQTPSYDHIDQLLTCDKNLTNWMHSLPPACKYRASGKADTEDSSFVVFLQRCLLHMIFYTTVSILHQSRFMASSANRTCDAACQITTIAQVLHESKLHYYLPSPGITAILVAMVIQLLESQPHPSRQPRNSAAKNLHLCIAVMSDLYEVFPDVEVAISAISSIIPKITSAPPRCLEDCDSTLTGLRLRNNGSFHSDSIGYNTPKTNLLPFGLPIEFGDNVMTDSGCNFPEYTTPLNSSLAFGNWEGIDPLFGYPTEASPGEEELYQIYC